MNTKCVTDPNQQSDSLNLLSNTSSTKSSLLPTVYEEPVKKVNKTTSKALVIFLLIVAILLCIALAVVVIWRYFKTFYYF
jgi:hypothetical protein